MMKIFIHTRVLLVSLGVMFVVRACAHGWYGGRSSGEEDRKTDKTDYSDQCQGTKTLPSTGESIDLTNPHYPDGTPASPGLHCSWSVTIPEDELDIGFIMVEFKEADTDGKFNITVEDYIWRFPGTSGLVSLSSGIFGTNINWMHIRYDCPTRRLSRKFRLEVSWHRIIANQTYDHSCKDDDIQCTSTTSLGLVCYNYQERCNDKYVCPDRSDENECDECKGGPDVDLTKTPEGQMFLISSPGWPGKYANNAACVWNVNALPGFVVTVKILLFQLEYPHDYLQIGNSHDHLSDRWGIVRLSGQTKLHLVISSHHEMHLKFVTDETVRQDGFLVGVSPLNHTRIAEPCGDDEFGCVEGAGVCIDEMAVCDGHQDCINADDEIGCESVNCDGFLCSSKTALNFTLCIPNVDVCNRRNDCPDAEDETLCHLIGCPFGCECTYTTDNTNSLHVICPIGWSFESVRNASQTTHIMELIGGYVVELQPGIFKLHTGLKSLSLIDNYIEVIKRGAFSGLINLTWLDLSDNPITRLEPNSFLGLIKLTGLVLSNVPVQQIYSLAFNGLQSLTTMVLITNTSLPVEVGYAGFYGLNHLSKFYVDNHRLCCNFEDGGPAQCISIEPTPPLFVCGSITQTPLLKLIVWVIGFGALIGNMIVLLWRSKRVIVGKGKDDPLRVQAFLIWNLAIADFMMGIYMMILGVADAHYGDHYYVYSEVWRRSFSCKFAGFISLVSSEASVFFIVLISVDQFIKVMWSSKGKRITWPVAVLLGLVTWGFSFVIGLVAVLSASPDSDVYDLSDVCIGLPLITRPSDFSIMEGDIANPLASRTLSVKVPGGTKPAWYFSIAIFLGLNLLCFVVISVCYACIFRKIKQMTKAAMKVQGQFVDMVEGPKEIQATQNVDCNGAKESENEEERKGNGLEHITKYSKSDELKEVLEDDLKMEDHVVDVDEEIKKPESEDLKQKANVMDNIKDTSEINDVQKDQTETKEDQGTSESRGKDIDDQIPSTDKQELGQDKNANCAEDNNEKDKNTNCANGNNEKDQDQLTIEKLVELAAEKDQEMMEEDVKETYSHMEDDEMHSNEEQISKMARKMFMIVLTDFCCWMPVITMGILAQCGVNIPVVAYVWTVVLILPINSSVNPYLYTFSNCKMGGSSAEYEEREDSLSSDQGVTKARHEEEEGVASEGQADGVGVDDKKEATYLEGVPEAIYEEIPEEHATKQQQSAIIEAKYEVI